jgi:phage tail sheath protein FI
MPCDEYDHTSRQGKSDSELLKIQPARLVPPCGHVAGIYSRSDKRIGVHKAPANEIVEDVLKLEIDFSDDDLAALNDAGVNCLHAMRGGGIRVWGARTLSGQPQWSYINVRRLFLTLTRWIRKNMNDVVYESNDSHLWDRIRHRLEDYCRNLYDQGALKGDSPEQAFYIKCDAETNSREHWEAGEVVAEVGLAPTVPAEFIVVRITQSASTTAVSGLNLL